MPEMHAIEHADAEQQLRGRLITLKRSYDAHGANPFAAYPAVARYSISSGYASTRTGASSVLPSRANV